jgi:hypothetical protein
MFLKKEKKIGITNFVISIFFLLINLSSFSYEKHILFDLSHGQITNPFDAGSCGMSQLITILNKENFVSSIVNYNLSNRLKKTNVDILVVGTPILSNFSTDEIKRIKKFVSNGGSLVLIPEHDNYLNNVISLNEIAKEFKISILPDGAHGFSNNNDAEEEKYPNINSVFFNLSNIKFYYSCSLDSTGIIPLAEITKPKIESNKIVAGYKKYGKGKVIVLCDYEFFWNISEREGINFGDNKKFILSVFNLLIKDKKVQFQNKNIECINYNEKILFDCGSSYLNTKNASYMLTKMVSEFKRKGYKVVFDTLSSQNYFKYDRVIIFNPFDTLKVSINEFLKIKKIAFFYDGYADMFHHLLSNSTDPISFAANTKTVDSLFGYNNSSCCNPINKQLSIIDVEIPQSYLSNGLINNYKIDGVLDKKNIPLYRSNYIKVKENSTQKYQTIMLSKDSTYIQDVGLSYTWDDDNIRKCRSENFSKNSVPLCIYNTKYFFYSNSDSFFDSEFDSSGRYIFKELLKFIE